MIAFFDPAGNGKSIVTHRVESITTDENGSLAWVTKGDANNAKEALSIEFDDPKKSGKIWQKVLGKDFPVGEA